MSNTVQIFASNGIYTITNSKDAYVCGTYSEAVMVADYMGDGARPSVIRAMIDKVPEF